MSLSSIRAVPAPLRSLLALVALAPALAGCGSEPERTPAACLDGSDAFRAALKGAPDQVLLEDATPISDCLTRDQPAGDLGEVGATLIAVATRLNAEAREDPSGRASTELGYLVGAAEAGAAETAGIHTDLIRRLSAAARFNRGGEPLPAAFERSFGTAYVAARESG
jgi:hypothetical protein